MAYSLCKKLSDSCPELEFVGYIEDLHAFLQGSVSVVPVRIGSGMRMKILDAISSRIPVVTTTKGVEGIDLRDGEECLKADSADEFVDTIIRLLGDVNLQKNWSTKLIIDYGSYTIRRKCWIEDWKSIIRYWLIKVRLVR